MAIPAVIVLLPFGLLFLLSGLVINLVQAILFVLIRPVSRNLYRRINRSLAELLWLQLIWLVDWWAGVQVELYADSETFSLMGKEHALLVSNHRSDIDWLVGWVLAQYIGFNGLDSSFEAYMIGFRGDSTACRYTIDNMPAKLHRSGCLGSALAVMKKSSKFLPVIGWSMWFAEYLFLERNWAKDERTLKRGLQQLEDFPVPFWLALFVEGTRFTPAKLLAAQEYATTQGIHVPRNCLVPRTKGFVASISILRSFVPAIYDTTVIIPKDQPSPTMMRILRGQSSVVHVHMRRRPMSELPKTDEEVSQWCRDIFVAKDDLLDKHIAEGSFGGEVRSLGRPLKSLLVVIFWSCLLQYGAFRFFKWTQLLATWKGVGFTTLGLVLVTLCMHIFVAFSQAERSSSAKAAKNRVKKE